MSRELLILIAVIIILFTYLMSRQKGGLHLNQIKQRLDDLESQVAGLIAQQPAEKIDKLEKRIQILEAIVTDKNYDLKREIDSL